MWEYDKESSQNLKSQSYFRTGWVDSATLFPSCPSRVKPWHTIHPFLWLGAKFVGCHPQLLIRHFVGHHNLQKREGTLLLFQQLLFLIDQLYNNHYKFELYTVSAQCLLKCFIYWHLKERLGTSVGPVMNPHCNAGDVGSIPGGGTKIPYAVELSPCATTRVHAPQQKTCMLLLSPNTAK